MIKTITRESIGKELFDEIIDYSIEIINVEHRKSSNYYCNFVYEVNEKSFPNNSELWGFWMSNTVINDHDYGMEKSDINELTRCEKQSTVITVEEWVHI